MSEVKVFLDVDGVLNVFGHDPQSGYEDWKSRKVLVGQGALRSKYKITWSPRIVSELAELDASLFWATSWGFHANRHLGPLFGWNNLPVAAGPLFDGDESWTATDKRKLYNILDLADKPFIWVDDEAITFEAKVLLKENTNVPYLLIAPDETLGLTAAHLAEMREFIEQHK